MTRRGIAITGMGIISSIGLSVEDTLFSLTAKKTGIGKVSILQTLHNNLPVAEVKLTDTKLIQMLGTQISPNRILTRTSLLGIIAARQALEQAGYFNETTRPLTGLISGTTVGGMSYTENHYKQMLAGQISAEELDAFDGSKSTEEIASTFGLHQYISTVSTACSSAANAIMLGGRLIRSGKLNRVLVGGTEALSRFTLNGFNTLEIVSPDGCKPFDENRNGVTIGEGAAYLVLEPLETTDPKRVLAILSGFANANDAYHATASSPEGVGARMSIQHALNEAKLKPNDINYINAHGTGTNINDLSEGKAIEQVFGNTIPPVSSTKGYTGHALGASGAFEAVFSVLALQNNCIFPNLGLTTPMPELSFEAEKELKTDCKIKHVLSNSFGFGGNNTSLIFSAL